MKRNLERLGHTLKDQLESKRFITANDCWEWTGSIVRSGYGQIKPLGYKDKKVYRVHRVSYCYYNGNAMNFKLSEPIFFYNDTEEYRNQMTIDLLMSSVYHALRACTFNLYF